MYHTSERASQVSGVAVGGNILVDRWLIQPAAAAAAACCCCLLFRSFPTIGKRYENRSLAEGNEEKESVCVSGSIIPETATRHDQDVCGCRLSLSHTHTHALSHMHI